MTFCFRLFAHKLQGTDRYLRKMKSKGSKSFNRKESLFCEADVSEKPLTSAIHAEPHLPFEVQRRGKCWVEKGPATHRLPTNGRWFSWEVGSKGVLWVSSKLWSLPLFQNRALWFGKPRSLTPVRQRLKVHSRPDTQMSMTKQTWVTQIQGPWHELCTVLSKDRV